MKSHLILSLSFFHLDWLEKLIFFSWKWAAGKERRDCITIIVKSFLFTSSSSVVHLYIIQSNFHYTKWIAPFNFASHLIIKQDEDLIFHLVPFFLHPTHSSIFTEQRMERRRPIKTSCFITEARKNYNLRKAEKVFTPSTKSSS